MSQGQPQVEFPEGDNEEDFVITVDGKEVYRTDHDSVGWEGMTQIQKAVEAVLSALKVNNG